jgi:hypothetical protein
MKRTKDWWSRLTKEQRSKLYYLERASNNLGKGSYYLPDNCSECGHCGNPVLGGSLCNDCLDELLKLYKIADGGIKNENV